MTKKKPEPKPKAKAKRAPKAKSVRDQMLEAAIERQQQLLEQMREYAPIAPTISQLAQFSDPEHTSRKWRFLLSFVASAGNVTRAAQAAKISRAVHYQWLEKDEKYRKAFAVASEEAARVLRDEAIRRAFEGVLKPIIYKGEVTGFELEYSDTIMIRLMEVLDPDFRRAKTTTTKGKIGETKVDLVTEEDLAKVPEETLLEQLRVARQTLDWLRAAATEA